MYCRKKQHNEKHVSTTSVSYLPCNSVKNDAPGKEKHLNGSQICFLSFLACLITLPISNAICVCELKFPSNLNNQPHLSCRLIVIRNGIIGINTALILAFSPKFRENFWKYSLILLLLKVWRIVSVNKSYHTIQSLNKVR